MRFVFSLVVALACALSVTVACYDAPPAPAANTPKGETLAASLACASCHGVDLSGSESPVGSTQFYAANLTPDPATGIGAWTDDQITRAIRLGIGSDDAPLCPVMPRFDTMSDDQAAALVAYLRSVPPVSRDVPSNDCNAPDLDDAGLDDAGVVIVVDDAPSCTGYADPTTPGHCHACSGATCQANGCFGGWFCDETSLHCVPKPSGC